MFRGTGVAIVTPFREDGSVDFLALENLIEHQITGGTDYIVTLGTTGEAATLTKDEACAVINLVIEKTNKRVPVVVGIGGNNTQAVVKNIQATNFTNIDGILSVSPYYNKPTQEGIYQHYKSVATASPVPVIIYNVPGRTGSNISAKTTLRLANDFKNIVATKEASGDFDQITEILKDKPADFNVISGDDGIALPMISLGASGVISVIANALPNYISTLVNLGLNNQYPEAQKIHFELANIIKLLFVEGNPGGIKAALNILKITEGHLRLPLYPIGDETYKAMQEAINSLPNLEKIISAEAISNLQTA